MKKSNLAIIGGVLVGIILLGTVFSMNQPKEQSSNDTAKISEKTEKADPNVINISDFKYNPEKIVIKMGTKITFVNKDEAHHDITPTSGEADFTKSKLLSQGESVSYTFNKVGKYSFKCSPHPYMKGEIEVTE